MIQSASFIIWPQPMPAVTITFSQVSIVARAVALE
jgi:hypothetical protein